MGDGHTVQVESLESLAFKAGVDFQVVYPGLALFKLYIH